MWCVCVCPAPGSRYVVDAELRSRRIVDVVQYSSIDFLKTFWSVAETGTYYGGNPVANCFLSIHSLIFVQEFTVGTAVFKHPLWSIPPRLMMQSL